MDRSKAPVHFFKSTFKGVVIMKLVTYLENGIEKVGALTADEPSVLPLP